MVNSFRSKVGSCNATHFAIQQLSWLPRISQEMFSKENAFLHLILFLKLLFQKLFILTYVFLRILDTQTALKILLSGAADSCCIIFSTNRPLA